jgi:hypothetical protein
MNETRDASLPVIGWTAAIVAGGIALVMLVAASLWAGQPGLRRDQAAQRFDHGPADHPEAVREWPAIEAANREHLHTYGWIDRSAGVVRIPIDQAMKRLAAP